MELCIMLLECCSQERTYLRYYGLLGQRFCMINKVHQENFEKCFVQQYSMIHRLETNKLRNVAKFFAHLLGTDALPWHVLAYIRLTEEDTTSSSRIFIKILFQVIEQPYFDTRPVSVSIFLGLILYKCILSWFKLSFFSWFIVWLWNTETLGYQSLSVSHISPYCATNLVQVFTSLFYCQVGFEMIIIAQKVDIRLMRCWIWTVKEPA